MSLARHFHQQAYQNAWANHRLLGACASLNPGEFEATRTGFFPSIRGTLNHLLTVDWFYIDALERELRGEPPHPDCYQFFAVAEPFASCEALRAAQQVSDRRLLAYCAQLMDTELERMVTIARPGQPQTDMRCRLLAHLFAHQIHHRGQVHAMLSGSSVKPPQLDEFYCQGEAHLRAAEFAELGFTEAMIWD